MENNNSDNNKGQQKDDKKIRRESREITYEDARRLHQCLSELPKAITTLTAREWCAISENHDRMETIVNRLEKIRIAMVRQYGTKKPDGNFNVSPQDKRFQEFVDKFNEVLNTKVGVRYNVFPLESLDRIPNIRNVEGILLFFKHMVDGFETWEMQADQWATETDDAGDEGSKTTESEPTQEEPEASVHRGQ